MKLTAILLLLLAVSVIWDASVGQVDSYYVHMATSLPTTNWTVYPTTGTSLTLNMAPQQAYFFVTASNFWGESGPSNTNATPAPLTNVVTGLKLNRTP